MILCQPIGKRGKQESIITILRLRFIYLYDVWSNSAHSVVDYPSANALNDLTSSGFYRWINLIRMFGSYCHIEMLDYLHFYSCAWLMYINGELHN